MAEFLTTTGCTAALEQIIRTARTELYLISPYIRLDNNFYERLLDAHGRGVTINVVFGKEDMLRDSREFFQGLDRLNLYYHKDLHAKCYFNERILLLSSMNLYVSSQREKNREMGVRLTKAEDGELYGDAREESLSIVGAAEMLKGVEAKVAVPVTEGAVERSVDARKESTMIIETPAYTFFNYLAQRLREEDVVAEADLEVVEHKEGELNYGVLFKFRSGRTGEVWHRLETSFDVEEEWLQTRIAHALRRLGTPMRVFHEHSRKVSVYPPKEGRSRKAGEVNPYREEILEGYVVCVRRMGEMLAANT